MQTLGTLLIVLGVLFIFLTWTGTTGSVLAAVFGNAQKS